jgi:oligopeptide transport system substrate-binding protein
MRKRWSPTAWALIAGVLAVAIASSAMGATGGASKAGVLRESIGSEPPSLDPTLATDTTSAKIVYNIFEPLVKLGAPPNLKATPSGASSWTVKGKVVTLNLNKQVRWTNGKPVTAQDYVWSWLRAMSPEQASDYGYQFFGIAGAEAYNSCDPAKANCAALRAKVGVKALGKYRLRITLTSPQPWFLQQISHHSFIAIPRATVEKFGNKWTEPSNIVTSGAFRLQSWKHNASLTLVKNTKWREASRVKLNQIQFLLINDATTALNAFKAGNTDVNTSGINPSDIKALKKTPWLKVYKALATYYYGINVKNVTDVNQRRAMAFAMDRKAITKHITQLGQQPSRGFTPIGISGGPTILKKSVLPTTRQLAKAKQFMAKAKNPKRDIKIYINNVAGHINIATAVQAYWKELGLNVEIKVMEWKQYLEFLGPPPNSDVDVYRLGWVYDYPDAQNGLVLWTCSSGNNSTNWCNKKFDATVARGSAQTDTAKRYQIYQQAEAMISGPNGDVPLIPIYWYVYSALVKENVKGYFVDPMDQTDYTVISVS